MAVSRLEEKEATGFGFRCGVQKIPYLALVLPPTSLHAFGFCGRGLVWIRPGADGELFSGRSCVRCAAHSAMAWPAGGTLRPERSLRASARPRLMRSFSGARVVERRRNSWHWVRWEGDQGDREKSALQNHFMSMTLHNSSKVSKILRVHVVENLATKVALSSLCCLSLLLNALKS